MDLLPFPWFEFLDVARSPCYLDGSRWRTFQKFSSMGNAYTFELETLIFYSLAYACCEVLGIKPVTGVNLSVYGDDVIIPQDAFDLFSEVSVACGFKLNDEKSFREGEFFESCGHDYFSGYLVRPFLIKKKLDKLLPSFYAANTIRRLQKRIRSLPGVDVDLSSVRRRLDGVHRWVVGCIPSDLRVLGPEGYGDGHLIAELDEAVTSRPSRVTRHRQFDGWWFRSYVEQPIRLTPGEWPMAYALYFTRGLADEDEASLHRDALVIPESVDNGSGYSVRGRTRVRRLRVFCHSTWQGHLRPYGISDYPVSPADFISWGASECEHAKREARRVRVNTREAGP
jgi:hypothetical protein